MTTNYYDPNNLIFIQSRAESDPALVEEYAALMLDGVEFDPAQGLVEGEAVYIWDGYHRGEAAKRTGKVLAVATRPGTRAEAEWLALGANQKHGLRRSNADKRRVVELALRHVNGAQLSDNQIAQHCGVDHKTVGKIRRELELILGNSQDAMRTVTRGGQSYEMNTAKIGSNAAFGTHPPKGAAGARSAPPSSPPQPQPPAPSAYKIPVIGESLTILTDWKCENCARRIPAGTVCTMVQVNNQNWRICPACLPDFRKRAGVPGSSVEVSRVTVSHLTLDTSTPDTFICPRCGGRTGRLNGGALCLSESCGATWESRADYESELDVYLDDVDAAPLTVDEDRAAALREINLLLARLPVETLSEVVDIILQELSVIDRRGLDYADSVRRKLNEASAE